MKKEISVFTISMANGGAERVISILLPHLCKDYKVHLVVLFDEVDYYIPEEVNYIVLLEGGKSVFSKIMTFPLALIQYYFFLKKNNIEISISFLARTNFINGLMKFFFKEKKIIVSERCFPSKAYSTSRLKLFFYKFLIPFTYNKADIVLSNSMHINEDLKRNFNVKPHLQLLYNPVKVNSSLRPYRVKITECFNIINVGTIYEVKNQKLLIDAAKLLNIEFAITFLGQGVLKEKMESLVRENKLETKISFKGRVKDVNSFLIKNDVFVLTSNSEGFPNCILEAMAIGLPIISTNCLSGPLEILNDDIPVLIEEGEFAVVKFGILINVNDKKGLKKALEHLFLNVELRKQLSSLSLERAKKYSEDVIYEELKSLIN